MRTTLILLLLSLSLCAQKKTFNIGLQAGPSLISLWGGGVSKDFAKSWVGFSEGISAEYAVTNNFSLASALLYERKGARFVWNGIEVTDNTGKVTGTIKYIERPRFDYLTVPLLARVSFGSKMKGFVNAGPYLGYLVSCGVKISGSTREIAPSKYNPKDFNRFDIGSSFGLGVSIPLSDKIKLSLEARENIGFSNLSKNTGSELKTNSVVLLVGLAYIMH
jgi:hypothetical protein